MKIKVIFYDYFWGAEGINMSSCKIIVTALLIDLTIRKLYGVWFNDNIDCYCGENHFTAELIGSSHLYRTLAFCQIDAEEMSEVTQLLRNFVAF